MRWRLIDTKVLWNLRSDFHLPKKFVFSALMKAFKNNEKCSLFQLIIAPHSQDTSTFVLTF